MRDIGRTQRILIVSNGHGEDAVGNALAREMLAQGAVVTAYPLVGLGHAYRGVPLLDPRQAMPSGGFSLRGSLLQVVADLRAGGWGLWREQVRMLRRHRGRYQRIIAIGDVYCLWMAAKAGVPATFIATAKSEHNEPHRWFEQRLMRRTASTTYTRDPLTAQVLASHGVNARYVGNPLMDTIDGKAEHVRDPNRPTITLVPGSRADAPKNLALLLRLCTELGQTKLVNIICALAPTIDQNTIGEAARQVGWLERDGILEREPLHVSVSGAFGAAVKAADIVVGLAGTANEQAAGLGKPVVAFPVAGAQYTAKFMRLQHRLLGDALVPAADWKQAVSVVLRLLDDPSERVRRGRIGRERMGEPGAVRIIARAILGQA